MGTDPLAVETQVRRIESIGFHAGRFWSLEAALWDIVGKVAGLPVSVLFGGVADRLPVYASWCSEQVPERRVDDARELVEAGFRVVKIRAHPARLDDGVATVREAVGDRLDVMVDLNQAWRMPGDTAPPLDLATIRRIVRRLADLDVFWVEEPLPYADVDAHRTLRADNRGLRLAAGEMLDSMPRTARHRAFIPHTWTNGLGLLANLHVAAGVGAGPYLEFLHDPAGGWTPDRRDFLLAETLWLVPDGCLAVPRSPGLGAVLAPPP